MKLSPHFSLDEFLVSQSAARHGIDMTASQEIIDNLEQLCQQVLEPLRAEIDRPIVISSGWRPYKLNKLIGGSRKSAHMYGRAADCRAIGLSVHDFALAAAEMAEHQKGPIDQVILEMGQWLHIGIADEPRYQVLTASLRDGLVVYDIGIV